MLKAGIGFVLASGLVVLACSSSSTGTGTTNNKGGGLGGLLGGGSSSSGGTATGTGAGQVLPDSCSAATNDDTCSTCAKGKCCNETLACRNDSACNTLVNCVVACGGDDACGQKCANDNAAGKTNAQAFVGCLQGSCETPCSDSSGTGTNTGSGVDTSNCLSDPPDTTLCNGFQGKPVSHDCPNGSPGASCVLQGQLSGIYCCPS